MKKTVSVLLAMVMLLLCGCSNSSYLTINGKSVEPEWVVKIDDVEIGLEEYRYYFLNLKYSAGLADEEWTDEAEVQLRNDTVEYLLVNYAVERYAEQMGVELDDEDMQNVEDTIDEMIDACGGKKEYKQMLENNYMTEDVYRLLVTAAALQQKLNNEVFNGDGEYAVTEEETRQRIADEYIRVRYLMLSFGDGQEDAANELLARIRSGEDFVSLVNTYGDDPTMNGNPDGIYFREGMTEQGFYEASAALEIGEISEVYAGESGYYIIKRMPLEQEYIDENIENFIDLEKQSIFSRDVSAIVDGMKIEFCDEYKEITTKTLK